MARQLTTNTEIDDFIAKVIGEANHHGIHVHRVIQPLSDEVRKRLNLNIDEVAVYERNGNLARTCWITISGNRYVFSYNYQTKKIELRDRTLRGAMIFNFDNATPLADIAREVGRL